MWYGLKIPIASSITFTMALLSVLCSSAIKNKYGVLAPSVSSIFVKSVGTLFGRGTRTDSRKTSQFFCCILFGCYCSSYLRFVIIAVDETITRRTRMAFLYILRRSVRFRIFLLIILLRKNVRIKYSVFEKQ